jgi:non-heme chloroperoxidase
MPKANFIHTRSGVDLFFRDWGRGPSVLLLAGWAMTSELWGPLMLRLNNAGLRTLAYDRRGHGRSSDPGTLDYDLLADDLADVMTTLNLVDCTVVAHSGAGGEAVRYITRHDAGRIGRLVLVGATLPAPMRSPSNPEGLDPTLFEATSQRLETDLAGWIDENAEPFAPGASQRTIDWLAGMLMGCSRRAIVDFQREIAKTDFKAELQSLTAPVTVIHGDSDVSAPLDLCGRRTAAITPNAELVVYPGSAHGPMVTDIERLAHDIALRTARRFPII